MKPVSIPDFWLKTMEEEHQLWLYAQNAERTVDRFYHISFESSLFSAWTVTIHYGRKGTYGQRSTYCAESEAEGRQIIAQALKRRLSSHKRIGVGYQM